MNTDSKTATGNAEQKRGADNPSIIRRLLLVLTLAVALIMGIFLLWDYHSGRRSMIYQQRTGLQEQARIILRTLPALEEPGESEIQQYIDQACAAMDETTSPGHHIVVEVGDTAFHANAHHHHTAEDWTNLRHAAQSDAGIATYGGEEIVAAKAENGGKTVYVSKNLSIVYEAMRAQVTIRLLSILLVTLVIILVTRMAIHRMLRRPLSDTINMMRDFVAGKRNLHMPDSYPKELEVVAGAFERMTEDVERLEKKQAMWIEEIRGINESLRSDINNIPGFDVKAFAEPAAEVSSDFYDVIPLPAGKTLFSMGDVGKQDLSSAVKTAILLNVTLTHNADDHTQPHELMKYLNDTILRIDSENASTSLFLALWDTEQRQISYACAGHETCYLLQPDGKEPRMVNLKATGPALGNKQTGSWATATINTGENNMLVLLSDGFAEVWSEGGEQFGRERLSSLLAKNVNDRPDDILEKLQTALAKHRGETPGSDDVTVLAAKQK